MEANELRIGNLIYRIQRVTEIHTPIELPMMIQGISQQEVDFVFYKTNPTDQFHIQAALRDICGIPLTKGLLENIEFPFLKGRNIFLDYIDKDWVWFDENPEIEQGYYFVDDDSLILSKRITYLHELQNFYFGLSGKELKIERYKV